MKYFTTVFTLYFILTASNIYAQSEGWSLNCLPNMPTIAEIMIDAYGSNEFYSEYVILKTKDDAFDIRNLRYTVINPSNNAFIGSVKIDDYSSQTGTIARLNNAININCSYNTVFRDIFSIPCKGIVPPHSAVLIFNNKDSIDLSFLSESAFNELCGSKVYVAFGTIKTQSPGVSIFRNHPRNGSCGTTGCLRSIQFQFEGDSSPVCNSATYDIKKLPHLNTSNPPDGYGDGSYIRPNSDGSIAYGGGNLTGTGIPMPPLSMMCSTPYSPEFGLGYWNVSIFDGINDFTHFKGFYKAKGNHIPIAAQNGSFEYNTSRDGWQPNDAPSEAHIAYGALATYDGCNVKKDSFSSIARRKGFPCGNYILQLTHFTDFTHIKIDNDGDGVWEFDQAFNPSLCSTECGKNIWMGTLNTDSKIEIWSYDNTDEFNIQLLFKKDETDPSPLNITSKVFPANCTAPLGSIKVNLSGGVHPYIIQWNSESNIPSNTLLASNLASGIYTVYVTDSQQCKDSLKILLPQINNIIAQAGNDTSFCTGGTALLRGRSSLPNGLYEWRNQDGILLSNQLNLSIMPAVPSFYYFKTIDTNGCFGIDTVFVDVYDIPYFTIKMTPKDTICNNENPTFTVSKGYSYQWSTFPTVGISALNSTSNDTIMLFSQLLPAISYSIFVEGTDGHGCKNTVQKNFVIAPLPTASIAPVKDTLCNNAAPYLLNVQPTTNGRFYVEDTLGNVIHNVIHNSMFYPQKTGVGKFTVYYEVTNSNGCKTNPAIEINVKSCCDTPDSTFIQRKTCHISEIGTTKLHLKKTNFCDSIVTITSTIDTIFIEKTTCNATQIGRDTIVKIHPLGCDSVIITHTIPSNRTISFNFKTVQPISCFGKKDGTIEINDIKGGTQPYTIKWNTQENTNAIQHLGAGTYIATVSDINNCFKIDSLDMLSPTPLSIEAVGIQARCLGDEYGSIFIKKTTGGTQPYTFLIDEATQTSNLISNISIGYHTLTLKDKNNCTTDTSIQVKEGRELIVDLGSDISINLGDSILLSPISNYPIQSIRWDVNPAISCINCWENLIKPQLTTNFKIYVKDSLGCSATDNITVFINKKQRVYIPSSFSPNNDTVNDTFMIYGGDEVKMIKSLQIYDRWGSLIFQATNILPNLHDGWDGTLNGKILPNGVFIYFAEIEFIDGFIDIYKGDVTLIR